MSEFNINVDSGTSVKLKTAGKYCDRDIVVNAIGSTGGEAKPEQEKIVDITENGTTEVTPDEGKVLSKVKVNVDVPNKYDEGYNDGYDNGFDEGYSEGELKCELLHHQPSKTITENGEHYPDGKYKAFSKVVVNVPIPEGYIKPSGTKEITENGTHDVTEYGSVNVNVPSSGGETTDNLGLLITQNLENVYSTVSGTLVPYAFYENEGIQTIELPSIDYLKERCFYGCGNLTTLKLPGLVGYTYQYMASGCSKLVDVDIHNSSYISSYSFQNCTSLKKLDLHKVETIGTNAFVGATKFETLILRTDAVPALGGTNAFTSTKIKSGGTGYIYVPKALIEEYKSATNWSSFASQFRAIEDYPDITGGA